jgi:hypothetical protein
VLLGMLCNGVVEGCDAFVVLADLTDDNVNACIEVGMGLATGTNVELLARGPSRRPPITLRMFQMPTYNGDIEQIGIVHKGMRHVAVR